ncbi:MAG: primosomal protein N' [Neisseria sp.]|nr:primosomal protein N' [Neisseria sp.]
MIYHHVALNVPIANGILTYSHHQTLPAGTRVAVPFRNKTLIGIVWANSVTPDIAAHKILPIAQVFNDVCLPQSWRDLLQFTSQYYHYPLGQAVATALPLGLKENRVIELPRLPEHYRLSDLGKQQTPPAAHAHKKVALWNALQTATTTVSTVAGGITLADLRKIHAQAAKILNEWQANGWIDVFTPEITCHSECAVPPALENHKTTHQAHTLNAEQSAASQAVQDVLGQFAPFVLHGITGSGKTEVYFDIMARVLAQGGQVLFLLPEINLTPQLLKRLRQRFPNTPTAVLHSQTAAGQRTQDYLRAMLGQAQLIIGTRLAVFTPLQDLRLVVVDEEHDASFKQDNELRYNARNLAIWRAKQSGCPIVLGSATPSLEMWHKAQTGEYRLLQLTQRANPAAKLPQIDTLNINRLQLENGFSPQSIELLKQNQKSGGLSLVYLNRRGFAPALFCGDCGLTFGCPNCSAKMVLHQAARQLRCHHCDYREAVPYACPDCGNQDLTALGQGTQRAEAFLQQLLPSAVIARVDRDSTQRKNDWEQLYQAIAKQEIDVLLGTQMLAKGHDFAQLNLVIVLDADGSLYSSDFRSPERLFAELMQVAGRAGRAEKAGRVLIQTRLPEHPVYAAVKAQNYAQFAEQELRERAAFGLSPFAFQAAIRADAPQIIQSMEFLNEIKEMITPLLTENVSQLGAVPMNMVRLAERERAQVFLESPSRSNLHRAVSLWQQVLEQNTNHNIRWHIDIDPIDA